MTYIMSHVTSLNSTCEWSYKLPHNGYSKLATNKYSPICSQTFSFCKGCLWSTCYKISGKIILAYNFSCRLGGGVAQQVVAAGLRCIVSNQDKWYLDHLDTTWQQFYMNEPLTNITNPNQQKLVLGGEVCMWGEHIDGSDIEQTIWPRAAAAAGTYFMSLSN